MECWSCPTTYSRPDGDAGVRATTLKLRPTIRAASVSITVDRGIPTSVARDELTTHGQPDDCEVGFEPTPDGVVVSLGGELDVANAGYLREQLVKATQDYPPKVRLDLAGLRFIDSSAIGLLVALKRSVNDYGGHFSVRCGPVGRMALGRRGLLGYFGVNPS